MEMVLRFIGSGSCGVWGLGFGVWGTVGRVKGRVARCGADGFEFRI